jgi:hypothetical protein
MAFEIHLSVCGADNVRDAAKRAHSACTVASMFMPSSFRRWKKRLTLLASSKSRVYDTKSSGSSAAAAATASSASLPRLNLIGGIYGGAINSHYWSFVSNFLLVHHFFIFYFEFVRLRTHLKQGQEGGGDRSSSSFKARNWVSCSGCVASGFWSSSRGCVSSCSVCFGLLSP